MDPRPDLRIPPLLMVFILFRMFSKNLTKRRAENQKFMGWIWKARNNAAGAKARRADKEHKYFTCRCGAICRVPVGKGKIVITCPKCGAKITQSGNSWTSSRSGSGSSGTAFSIYSRWG